MMGKFSGVCSGLSLKDIKSPLYLRAGERDDITPRERVFNAAKELLTARARLGPFLQTAVLWSLFGLETPRGKPAEDR